MANDYITPSEVVSPKRQWSLRSVLYDRGPKAAAVAMGAWDGKPVLAMRWNGDDENPIGNPQSRGLATWFVVPDEFREAVLARLQEIEPQKYLLAKEYIMNAVVLTNTIPLPDVRQQVQAAVLNGIEKYPTREPWRVKIFAPADKAGYFIRIQAPNGFTWEKDFEGPVEEAPNFIERTVSNAQLLRAAAEEAARKLPGFSSASRADKEAMILTQIHRM